MDAKTTRIQRASTISDSVRSTLPNDIVGELGLEVGDVIAWDIVSEKGKKYARLRKLE